MRERIKKDGGVRRKCPVTGAEDEAGARVGRKQAKMPPIPGQHFRGKHN